MKRVWFKDQLVTGTLALSAFDRGVTLGDGVFETLAVRSSIALWRFEHIERMRGAAQELGIPFPEADIENAIDALTYRTKGHSVLRLTLTRGESGRGLAKNIGQPILIGTLQSFDQGLRFQSVSLVTSNVRRNLYSLSSRLKTISYIDNVMAARAAHDAGVDDALMLNSAGRVACSTIGNVFLEMNGELVTPSLAEGILPGVMRHAVLALARRGGIPVRERQVKVTDIAKADLIFVTNSLRFVRVVSKLDGKPFSPRSKLVDRIVQGLMNMEQEQIILS